MTNPDMQMPSTTMAIRSRNHFRPKPGWKSVFLEALANTGNIRAAVTASGVQRSTVLAARVNDQEFADLWEEAVDQAVDLLEYVAWQRATTVSDPLLIFLLKGNRPEKYRENSSVQITGPNGGPIQLVEITDDERFARLDSLYDRIRERRAGLDSDGGVGLDAGSDSGVEFDYAPNG